MGPETIAVSIPIAAMATAVLIVYFAVSRKHAENVELIKRGIIPGKYDIKLPGRLGLPWGFLFLAIGLGALLAMILTGEMYDADELGATLACLLAGIGLIIYWKMTASDRERALKIKEELMLREGADFEPDRQPDKTAE